MRREYRSRVNFGPRNLGMLDILKATSAYGSDRKWCLLGRRSRGAGMRWCPACRNGQHTSFGFGKNARWAHSARLRARRCDEVRCSLGTVTDIFPLLTVLMALRASGVQ